MSFDDKAIYIAFRCEEPNAGQLRSEKLAPNDMGIFKGNAVEVLINATRSDSMFYRFAVNSSGSFWAAHHLKGKPEPLTQPWEHAARLEPNGWTVELALDKRVHAYASGLLPEVSPDQSEAKAEAEAQAEAIAKAVLESTDEGDPPEKGSDDYASRKSEAARSGG